jgi:hypothetical protein
VRRDDGEDLVYTLVLNKGYKNLTSLFEDEEKRSLDDDTLTVHKGFIGTYPNFFFIVAAENVDAFADRFAAIEVRDDYEQFVALYGIRRTNLAFWEHSDWFHDEYARRQPLESGVFDLNRYKNR